ncbi:MAG: hypothetical protein JSV65_18210 [Armatimonadota bacterium]|nr:MAG: hypothetical protein JSV65_18210 [Armatimonadota bacterium]
MTLGVVLLVVVVAVYLLLVADLRRTLNQRLADLRAAGIPTSLAEAAPPPAPDADNAALLYEQAIARLDLSIQDSDAVRAVLVTGKPVDRAALARVEGILRRNRIVLDLLAQAARKSSCRFSIDWDVNAPGELQQAYLRDMRPMARLLAADARVAVYHGDFGRAAESCRNGLSMAGHVAAEPTLFSFLSSVAVNAIMLRPLEETLASGDLDHETCAALFRELERPDMHRALRRALELEATGAFWLFEAAEQRPRDARAGLEHMTGSRVPVVLYLNPVAKPVRMSDEIAYIASVEKNLILAEKPYREAAALYAQARATNRTPIYHLVSLMFRGPSERAVVARDRVIAMRGGMQVALALEAYHTKRGTYPNTLDSLRDYPGWELPPDPFSGEPLMYQRHGEGYVLYSWGYDLDDDGGRPARAGGEGDLVWQFDR